MKRCPECKRVENDDTLTYCRADGTPLVSDPDSASAEAGVSRPTGPTIVLDRQQTISRTRELSRPNRTKTIMFVGAAVFLAIALALSTYFYVTRKNNAAIQSLAVLPFTNQSGNADVEY